MKEKFVIWGSAPVTNALVPKKLEGIEPKDKLKLWFGHDYSKNNDFPEKLQFTASPDYPNNLKLVDYFGNTESVFPVSPKLKAFLEGLQLPNLLFVPVDMLNHKGKVLATYHLMHLTALVDCIDVPKSKVTEDFLREGTFAFVKKLALNEKKIPGDAQLFRIARLYKAVAVRRDLAKKVTDAGFEGIAWREIGEYTC